MFFTTKSGSRYEINTERKTIRRLTNTEASNCIGPIQNGVWMAYEDGFLPKVGCRVILDMVSGKTLMTSVVEKIEE